jgi:uncharacterized membrane protein
MNKLYVLYLLFAFVLVGTILVTPFLAHAGAGEIAGFFYNAYVPTCHQWIYRSSCVFNGSSGYSIGDCIRKGQNANITTEFTNAPRTWDGEFIYSRDQIGRNRAEKVEYDSGIVGYKFPNDTRDLGIYIFMLLAGIIMPFVWKNNRGVVPHPIFLIAAILPLAIDGTGQLLEFWESTNTIRFITGAIAGIGVSVFIFAISNRICHN